MTALSEPLPSFAAFFAILAVVWLGLWVVVRIDFRREKRHALQRAEMLKNQEEEERRREDEPHVAFGRMKTLGPCDPFSVPREVVIGDEEFMDALRPSHFRTGRAKVTMTRPPTEAGYLGRNVMEWFSRTTSVAGTQIPNWVIVLGAIILIWLIYTFM
jgi:hypothetical protein